MTKGEISLIIDSIILVALIVILIITIIKQKGK